MSSRLKYYKDFLIRTASSDNKRAVITKSRQAMHRISQLNKLSEGTFIFYDHRLFYKLLNLDSGIILIVVH